MIVEVQGMGFWTRVRLPSTPLESKRWNTVVVSKKRKGINELYLLCFVAKYLPVIIISFELDNEEWAVVKKNKKNSPSYFYISSKNQVEFAQMDYR